MASSCWCWFSVYFAASITLGVIAITATIHPSSKNSSPSQEITPLTQSLSRNASRALRKAGYTHMADLLHRSPPFFLPPQNTTFFAIKDSAFRNTSLPRWFLKSLLLYHTTTTKASMKDLLHHPTGTCMETLFRQKNISLTKVQRKSLEINHVKVSNPDIFHGEHFVIHGVLAPFSPLRRQDLQGGSDFIHSPTCRSNQNATNSTTFADSKNVSEWNRIVQVLGSKGYSSFSIALHSVLGGIEKDSMNWGSSATIFAPPDLGLIGYPATLLDRAVRLHVLPQRITYRELSSLPVRTLLKTVVPGEDLEVDGVLDFMPGVVISGVEIVAPDLFTSEKFVVHGISRAFKMAELTA
ncbi:fasciclin-like arabinogalactan protein 21 [Lotus japonicus]|uniref:fasciclin-like arabinogalactan protein 21 n=1 Tax=Lotus japonicus TaxID=34305 RepID=UPI002585FCE6|nr:fasciclin-like arabinogalactan protein 21 [Lotus japonicus]